MHASMKHETACRSNPQPHIYSLGAPFSYTFFVEWGVGPKALPFWAASVTLSTQFLQFFILEILANRATPLRYMRF